MAAVWMAQDRRSDRIHLYDACVFASEVLAVIAEGLNARGRWIPIAWLAKDKATAEMLQKRGCNMIRDPYEEDDAMAAAISRNILERMRSQRWKVDKRLVNWLEELRSFSTTEGKVPRQGFPLMAATRNAMAMFDDWARAESTASRMALNYPKRTVV